MENEMATDVVLSDVMDRTSVKFELETNFDGVIKRVQEYSRTVAKMKLSEKNLDKVTTIKKGMVAMRNSVANFEKEKARQFDDGKKVLKAAFLPLLTAIEEVEERADAVLDRLEDRRREVLQVVLNDYHAEFQKEYHLDAEHLLQFHFKKEYYNKTADELDVRNDMRAQFAELAKAQADKARQIKMITEACARDARFDTKVYIGQLQYKDFSEILDNINERYEEFNSTEVEEEPLVMPKVTKGKRKVMRIEIDYPTSLSVSVQAVFDELKEKGVRITAL